MDMALRSISESERSYVSNLSTMLRNAPLDFIKENHVIEYLAIRGYYTLIDEAAAYINTIALDTIAVDTWPALFEMWRDYFIWKSDIENPMNGLTDELTMLIPDKLVKDADNRHVFLAMDNNIVDIEVNAALGAALSVYGEFSAHSDWAAIGRSIILSVLNITDDTGAAPAFLEMPNNGTHKIADGTESISASSLYFALSPSQFFPHAASISLENQNIWLWTVSPAVSATFENNALDIDVNFLLGETHYLIIRGIKPFSKIQLRGMDYRSDPQFESYNAPGWAYSGGEQTLLVKLVHRTENEKIRVFY
jgi:hypothetical protein